MHPDRRSTTASGLIALIALLLPSAVAAMCNALPTTERTFASTLGAIDRPYAAPGREVKLMIGGCEAPDAVFAPPEGGATNTIEVVFTPPHGPPATITVPQDDVVSVLPTELVFRFPDARELLGTLRTGPATVIVRVGATELVRIDELGTRNRNCRLTPHAIFGSFTVLPPANRFHCLTVDPQCSAAAPAVPACCTPEVHPLRIRATVDDAGNLLMPWDWGDVFPTGSGFDPIARLVMAGQSGLEAFPPPDSRSGRGIAIPDATYVSAHTPTGSVLPPFLDVGPPTGLGPFPGSTLIGTVDSLDGVLRIARRVGDAAEIFDLASRLADGIGAIEMGFPVGVEGGLVDLRSVRGSTRVTALEEVGRGASTAGLLVYDNSSGGLGRVSEAPGDGKLPRRVAVSDDLVAFYDVQREQSLPDLTVLPVAVLAPGIVGAPQPVDAGDLITTGLFGSPGDERPPALGTDIVGGYAGSERSPRVFDVLTGEVEDGTPIGGRDLVEQQAGIVNWPVRDQVAPVLIGGELAPAAPGVPGRVLAVGNRAVFAACQGPCTAPDGSASDVVLTLVDADVGRVVPLARNVGVPFVFTGSLIGLTRYEDGRQGGPGERVDLDGNGAFDGVFIAVYDLEADRLMLLEGPNGGPVALAPDADVVAREYVLALGLDEEAAGPLNCDADRTDRVFTFVNGRARTLVNTREPIKPGALAVGRTLATVVQPEDAYGQPLGSGFLNVMRDSDGDEILDPYDDCPLHANLDQADRDGDGIGDTCDADCVGRACADEPETPAVRRCRGRLQQAAATLLDAELQQVQRCRASAAACERGGRLRARALNVAHTLVARCDADALAAIALCGDSPETIFPATGDGCFATRIARAAPAVASVAGPPLGGDAVGADCQRRLAAITVHYARQRHRVLSRCRTRLLAGEALDTSEGTPVVDPWSCRLEVKTAGRLARLGARARSAIERACSPAELRTLAPCAGADSLDAIVGADGTTGCLIATAAQVVDRVVTAELGAAAEFQGVSVPCPPPPVPTVTPTPRPGSISIRARLAAPDGRPADLDLGWSGILHNQQVFGGAAFDADLQCGGSGPCTIHGWLAGQTFGAPVPVTGGGTAMCLTMRFTRDVVGSFDRDKGELSATLPLRAEAVHSSGFSQPCPACIPNDGQPDLGDPGVCSGGARSGATCRLGGLANPAFGVVAGTSADCPPTPETTLKTVSFTVVATTGTSELAIGPDSPSCSGDRLLKCPCALCDDPDGTPCHTSADCPERDGAPGVCGGRKCNGGTNHGGYCTAGSMCPGGSCRSLWDGVVDLQEPNDCAYSDPPVEERRCDAAGDDGLCAFGPPDQYCSDEPFRGCTADAYCTFGSCLSRPRACFPDPMARRGTADPPVDGRATPTLVGTFCVASTQFNINRAGGLPGPGALVLPVDVQFQP